MSTLPDRSIAAALDAAVRRVRDLRAATGLVILVGTVLATLGSLVFVWLAEHVRAGGTQPLDDAAMQWIGRHQVPWLQSVLLEVTYLGTATVVLTVAGVAALFLTLTHHKYSAALLVGTTAGAIVLNTVLKHFFHRPRPRLFAWGTPAATTSFPSGHAMSAIAIYATVAYLAARLHRRRRSRLLTMAVAAVLICLICASRIYLGVHYPSDVLAGLVIGGTWAAFCMTTLEVVQRYARRHAPDAVEPVE